MSTTDRRVRETFVELADTLVDDYDVLGFLDLLAHRVVELLDVDACGVVLADHHGTLNLVAASSEETRLLELSQLQNSEGPCLDAFRTGRPVSMDDLTTGGDQRWPRFAPAARGAGYAAVHALPMRLREVVIGAMNVFGRAPGSLGSESLALGQAMADVATIGILHERTTRQHEEVAGQLQAALDSRILVEQAKGVLAERLSVSVDDAFALLRAHARSTNSKLRDIAAAVVDGTLTDVRRR
ncbi:GAF and ANTAR domain-containing protein [Jiangella rhizosphaerae]|uniref:ANTAR domain-containing protein n=1 Tax=Jiangella rhizosphaerae TaxID=2293569 RepID=A0A418KUC1_9ACTN|nr:GAF and ANTAR domain-containing protein [Jiangella rhizosphaerae]RIQ30891.1 ANTAR domain-containing protein [Jiangella rhizosphaerae]